MSNDKKGGNASNQSGSGGSGSDRPQAYTTGLVQKDSKGADRPKSYGTRRVQEGASREK